MTSSHFSGRRHEPHRDARACEHACHEDDHAYGRLRRLAWPFAVEGWIGHAPGIARYSLSLGSIAPSFVGPARTLQIVATRVVRKLRTLVSGQRPGWQAAD